VEEEEGENRLFLSVRRMSGACMMSSISNLACSRAMVASWRHSVRDERQAAVRLNLTFPSFSSSFLPLRDLSRSKTLI
jgi:hypothetical protein